MFAGGLWLGDLGFGFCWTSWCWVCGGMRCCRFSGCGAGGFLICRFGLFLVVAVLGGFGLGVAVVFWWVICISGGLRSGFRGCGLYGLSMLRLRTLYFRVWGLLVCLALVLQCGGVSVTQNYMVFRVWFWIDGFGCRVCTLCFGMSSCWDYFLGCYDVCFWLIGFVCVCG